MLNPDMGGPTATHLEDLIVRFGLERARREILDAARQCIAFELVNSDAEGISCFGGRASVPESFSWPTYNDRPLDFLLAMDLLEVNRVGASGLVPDHGTLAFFYDLDSQPWGYDAKFRQGFHVAYFPPAISLQERPAPNQDYELPRRRMRFSRSISVPVAGSRAFDDLDTHLDLSDEEWERYQDFSRTVAEIGRSKGCTTTHQLFGHSMNVQGDMQLEAQLVSHGLYCGNPAGYQDPRRKELEPGAAEWALLLQLDSDDSTDTMWGDDGLLYYWLREQDLRAGRFDQVWGTMQCY